VKPSDAIDLVALACERWPAPKLDALSGDGREFRPNAGDVRRRVAALQLGAPDWAEVKAQLVARHVHLARRDPDADRWTCPEGTCDGSGWVEVGEREAQRCPCYAARVEASRALDLLAPLVREFFDDGYVTWAEVDELCSSVNTTLEAQARDKWNRFVARAVESRVLAAIEGAPDLPRIEEARHADARRSRRGLARPRFLAALTEGRER
jgi:hypothetical protein